MRISDWSSDVCSSDLRARPPARLMHRLAIFDCDGTLVDSQANICRAVEEAFTAHRIDAPPRAAIRRIVGLSLVEAMRMLRSAEHTSELQSLMRISYAVFCLKKKKQKHTILHLNYTNMTHNTNTNHH